MMSKSAILQSITVFVTLGMIAFGLVWWSAGIDSAVAQNTSSVQDNVRAVDENETRIDSLGVRNSVIHTNLKAEIRDQEREIAKQATGIARLEEGQKSMANTLDMISRQIQQLGD